MSDRLKPWLHYTVAQVLCALRLNAPAEAQFRAAIDCDPGYADAWRALGFLLGQLGRAEHAIGCLVQALRIDSGDDVSRFNLAFMLHQSGRAAEAVAEFEQVIRTSPNNDRAWYGLGLCRDALGDAPGALAAVKEAARLQYFNPHAAYHLVRLLKALGEHDQARAEYQRLKSFDPKVAEQVSRDTGVA